MPQASVVRAEFRYQNPTDFQLPDLENDVTVVVNASRNPPSPSVDVDVDEDGEEEEEEVVATAL